MIKVYIG